jgi:tetratricopeptide (TPR) repeat protein
MKRPQILLSIAALLLIAGIYFLPKVVINEDEKGTFAKQGANRDGAAPAASSEGHLQESPEPAVDHRMASPEAVAALPALRAKLAEAKGTARFAAMDSLALAYKRAGKPDSAALYLEQLAQAKPSERNLERAANQYFEAFSFAADENRSKRFGDKTRKLYEQVLARNPNNLDAKTNTAMTYVASETPMKGIMMLREVITADPANEKALYNLGILSMQSKQWDKAVDRFRQLVKAHPKNVEGRFYLGVTLAETGKTEEAKQVFAEVKKMSNDPALQTSVEEYEQKLDGKK